ncbi:hypothetical protein JCM24511_10163 [Saitozyma sp. JCM 24511]|nr:hypothetical protein JCM24511_10163 [Saitozyma sp. JCM 24511]
MVWKQRLTLALLLTRSNSYIDPKTKPPQGTLLEAWAERDNQVAAAILSTTSESILSAHIDLLSDTKREAPRSRTIYESLVKQYGSSGPQYVFGFGRTFIESKCAEGEDVEVCVYHVQALYRELKLLSFDLDSLCINVLLNGLPDRFASFVDSIWKAEENPSIEDIKIEILRVNAGQLNRLNDMSFAARAASLSPNSSTDTSLKAFYARLKQSGTTPSEEHPCA